MKTLFFKIMARQNHKKTSVFGAGTPKPRKVNVFLIMGRHLARPSKRAVSPKAGLVNRRALGLDGRTRRGREKVGDKSE